MTWTQRDQYKMSNLNRPTRSGFMRVQVCSTYKAQCIYSIDYLAPTIRCVGGGGQHIAVEASNEDP